MGEITLRDLLEAGVHFGHQTRRWDPRMKPYIFMERNGIHIIDLQKTLDGLERARTLARRVVEGGGKVLFVGTKPQARHAVREHATRANMPYVHERWLGGTLTNFNTIRRSLGKLERLEKMEQDGSLEQFSKKEILRMQKEKEKLLRSLGGIREMSDRPGAIFIIDTKKEANAVREARKLGIPIIGIIDTNADPDEVDIAVPGNDDAMRAIDLYCRVIADACLEAQASRLEGRDAEAVAAETGEAAPAAPATDGSGTPAADGPADSRESVA